MPDLLTHVLAGLSIGIVIQKEVDKRSISLILLGSIIIDIDRPITWTADLLGFEFLGLTEGFHSILGMLALCLFAASLFDSLIFDRTKRFLLLVLGATSHLILDMTMWPWDELGLFLLYPVRLPFSFHLFWPDFMLYPLIGILLLFLALGFKVIRNMWTKDD